MAAQWQININSGVSPDPVELSPAQDIWASLERRVRSDPSTLNRVSFEPSSLSVQVGDQIFWTNNDSEAHWPGLKNADGSIDDTFFMPNQIAEVSDLGPSTSSIFAPGGTGTLEYVCSLHCKPGQTCCGSGTIEVT